MATADNMGCTWGRYRKIATATASIRQKEGGGGAVLTGSTGVNIN